MCGSTRNVARVARPFPSTIKLSITKQERGKGLAGQTKFAHDLFSLSGYLCVLSRPVRSRQFTHKELGCRPIVNKHVGRCIATKFFKQITGYMVG